MNTAVFSRIARRLIMNIEWLTPTSTAPRNAQFRGSKSRNST
jgi:hypothetical protein